MSRTFLTLLLVLGAVVVVEGLNFTGFCYSHARYYGGEELIDGAIWHNRIPTAAASPGTGIGLSISSGVRLFGFYIVVVEVWYRASETATGPAASTTRSYRSMPAAKS